LAINIHLGVCSGCRFHNFPYEAKPPINGSKNKLFKSVEDVKESIKELINEVKYFNEKGKKFDVATNVAKQLPFFCCSNYVINKEYQRDIQRYIYCNETKIPAYNRDYGNQPFKWVQKYFILKNAFANQEKNLIEKNNASSR
jgi:hypothetical protein